MGKGLYYIYDWVLLMHWMHSRQKLAIRIDEVFKLRSKKIMSPRHDYLPQLLLRAGQRIETRGDASVAC
jgi:hypothetical protein